MEQSMKAIVRDTYGTVDVLQRADIDMPVASESEVLVRVRAAGVDQGVWRLMAGMPYVMRLAGFGVRAPKNGLLGQREQEQLRGLLESGTITAVVDRTFPLFWARAAFAFMLSQSL
jgi:NADPH:quinone reductase-like Zn-dependent oxidoreductase